MKAARIIAPRWGEKVRRKALTQRSRSSARGPAFAKPVCMTLTITGLLILLIIAGVCGAIGRAIGGGTGGGFLVSIAVGFVGALLGSIIAAHFHLPELLRVSVEGRTFPILWSIIGASLFVALVHLLSGGVGRRYRYY